MADGGIRVVHVCRANIAESSRIRALLSEKPRLAHLWMWTMTMLVCTKRGARRGCLCVGNSPMTQAEWARELGLRPKERAEAWKKFFDVGSFEWREIDGQRFVSLYGFGQNQDRVNKKKSVKDSARVSVREADTVAVLVVDNPVDKSAKSVDKSVDKSVSGGHVDHNFESSSHIDNQSFDPSVVDSEGVTSQDVGVFPIQNVNRSVNVKEEKTVTGSAAGPPSLPPGGGKSNGTGKPNGYPKAQPVQPVAQDPESVGRVLDRVLSRRPTAKAAEANRTEPGTEPALSPRPQSGGPAADPVTVSDEAVSRLVEDLVTGLNDEHSRAFWRKRVGAFREIGGFVRLVQAWTELQRRMLRGEGPRRPAQWFNRETARILAELRTGVGQGKGE